MRNKILTLHSIAGYAMEIAIWKMLRDICKCLETRGLGLEVIDERCCLSPGVIQVDGDEFRIIKATLPNEELEKFLAPETGKKSLNLETALVWSIGALVCYMSSGHYVFGGRGGEYQRRHPAVGLPVLRKEHETLANIVHRCMQYHPTERISLSELKMLSDQGYKRCLEEVAHNTFRIEEDVRRCDNENMQEQGMSSSSHFWPEEM